MSSHRVLLWHLCLVFLLLSLTSVECGRRNNDGKGRRWKKLQQSTVSSFKRDDIPSPFAPLPLPSESSASSSIFSQYPSDHAHFPHPPSSHDFVHFGEDGEEGLLSMADIKTNGHECEPIRIDDCRGIGYNVTSMPNFVGHELQSDAELQLQSFMPLVQYGCSSQLLFFLCSVYTPMCTEKVPVIIGPCRPLCESVKSRCAPVLQELGFPWPAALNCSKFVPENTVDHMCMEGPPPDEPDLSYTFGISSKTDHFNSKLPDFLPHSPPSHQPINHDIIINPHPFDNSVLMPKSKAPGTLLTHLSPDTIHEQVQSGLDIDNDKAKSKCSQYRFSDSYVYLEHPRGRCVSRCMTDVLFTQENKRFIEYWTFIWSILALCSCLFTMISFVFTSHRFLYPERAIFYVASCYSIYAFSYLYRTLVGRNTIACYQDGPDNISLLVQEGAHNLHCTLSFLMLYYFGMAGAAWWLILASTWSLNAAFTWPTKKLSQYSQLYHSIAWTLPALQTLAALVTRAVDADELTGTCYVGNQNDENLFKFVIIPMSFYLGAGIFLILSSFLAVRFGYCVSKELCCCDSDDSDCCCECSASNGQCPESLLNLNAAIVDTDTDLIASVKSESAASSTGCGDFCRRFRRNYSMSSGPLRTSTQAGSGHSLLIPPTCANVNITRHVPVNFCSTVSSTSSYSSSSTKTAGMIRLAGNSSIHYQQHPHSYPPSQPSTMANEMQFSSQRGSVGRSSIRSNRRRFSSSTNHNENCPCRTRNIFRTTPGQNNKDAALVRSGIFALFYTLPALCVLAAHIYEYILRDSWLRQPTDLPVNTNEANIQPLDKNRPNFEVFNMKIFMSLVIGIKTGIWILTAKFPINLWRGLFSRCFMKKLSTHNSIHANLVYPTRTNGGAVLAHHYTVYSQSPTKSAAEHFFFTNLKPNHDRNSNVPTLLGSTLSHTVPSAVNPGMTNAAFSTGGTTSTIVSNSTTNNNSSNQQQQLIGSVGVNNNVIVDNVVDSLDAKHKPSSQQLPGLLFRTGNETAV